MGGYTDGGRVDLVNNGEVNGNMAVGAEKEGHVSADNRESGTVYGEISRDGQTASVRPQLSATAATWRAASRS